MKQIFLSNENGVLFKVDVVRYFRFKNNVYLIYTLNEKDHKDYIKLYVVKVMKELGEFVTQTVRRQDEWNAMKNLIKRILSELKKGELKIIADLEVEELDKIVIYENRNFSLASDLVNLLASSGITEYIETSINDNNEIKNNENIEVLGIEPSDDTEILEVDDNELEEILEIDEEEFIESLELEENKELEDSEEVEVLNI